MPKTSDFLDFDPLPLTNLRERLAKQQARRMAELRSALQPSADPSVSRLSRYGAALLDPRAAQTLLRDQLGLIQLQDDAQRAEEARFKALNPLQRKGLIEERLHRSTRDRVTAIAGMLERERRQSAPITREAFSRAKAIAAARRRFSSAQGLHGARGYPYAVMPWELEDKKIGISFPGLADPCLDYFKKQAVRREVMFAQRYAGRGYRGRRGHSRSPC